MASHIKSIALVGASGNVGAQTLKHLLASPHAFNITLISRTDSKATFPNHPSLTLRRGDYASPTFLASAFADIDVLILALGFMAMPEQTGLISAAVEAGVEWILPTEYACDGMNAAMVARVPMVWPKREAREQIARLAAAQTGEGAGSRRTKWIGVATNPWVPWSVQTGMFGIEPYNRTATLYSDAGRFNVSTLEQVGKGIAALLSLPVTNAADPRASLEHYANDFVYISSALTTQRELLDAALEATGTSESDWKIGRSSCAERLRAGEEKFAAGDMLAGADVTYAAYMGEGMGGDYEIKAKEDREVLGLAIEEVEGFVKKAVEMGAFKVM